MSSFSLLIFCCVFLNFVAADTATDWFFDRMFSGGVFVNSQNDNIVKALRNETDWSAVQAAFDDPMRPLGPAVLVVGDATGVKFTFTKNRAFLPDTETNIYSATKLISVVAIMRMIQEDKLFTLDSKMSDQVSWWTNDTATDARANITLTHMLTMSTGFFGNSTSCASFNGDDRHPTENCVRILYDSNATYLYGPPGTKFAFDEAHMLLASLFVEKATNRSWSENVQKYILSPLGLAADAIKWDLFKPERPSLTSGAKTTTNIYAKILQNIYANDTFLTPTTRATIFKDYISNEMMINSPFTNIDLQYHYGLGAWVECGLQANWTSNCTDFQSFSSVGFAGFYPALHFKEKYWVIVGQNFLIQAFNSVVLAAVVIIILLCIVCCGVVGFCVYRYRNYKRVEMA